MGRCFRPLAAAVLLAVWGSFAAPATGQEAEGFDYGGLAPGPGRDAVYFTCRACHSLKQFTQQRMSREDWNAVLDRMVEAADAAEGGAA